VSGWTSEVNHEVVDTWSGFATYTVRTQDGKILRDDADYSTASVERTELDDPETYQPEAPGEELYYSCDTVALHEFGGTYDAWFERRE
jgi:hypothetical protein